MSRLVGVGDVRTYRYHFHFFGNASGSSLNDVREELEERFWDMFIVDAYIGNSDRNNGNWGIIRDQDGNKRLAPVYDNGNSFNNKWDDTKIHDVLLDEKMMEIEGYKGRRCIFENQGKRINPYHYVAKTEEPLCLKELMKIVPLIQTKECFINNLVDELPNKCANSERKQFFKQILQIRMEKVLIPAYERAIAISKNRSSSQIDIENNSKLSLQKEYDEELER